MQRASLERTLANMDFIKARFVDPRVAIGRSVGSAVSFESSFALIWGSNRRRELSEAEKLRQASLHKELMELKSTLRELEYSSSSTCGTSPTSPR